MLAMFSAGFEQILTPVAMLCVAGGVFLGILFGCVPGLTGSMAVALCLPLTYSLTAVQAFGLIMGIYVGGCSGGLISAILLNIPGTPANLATAYDGAVMARKGLAGKALGTGIFYSFLGGSISFIILFLVAEPIARIAVKFSYFEYFAIVVFSLTMIIALSGKQLMKGFVSALVGVAFSFIGLSAVDGATRMTLGISELNGGLKLLPALIGLYAVSELIKASRANDKEHTISSYKIKGFGFTWKEFKEQFTNFLRSAAIGTGIGILPGIGGITSNLLAYTAAKASSKHPEKYGTGYIGGIVAPETSNNAAVGGALIPLLTLGIPGDGFTAIVLGALMVHGLQPGPQLMTTNGDFIYAIFAALIIANILTVVMQYFGIRGFVRMLSIPKYILLPVILVLAVVGSIGLNNRVFDAWTVLVFGLLGFGMKKLDFPLTPIILGFVLGPIAEINLRRALMLSRGSLLPFVTRPVSCVFLVLAVLSMLFLSRLVNRVPKNAAPQAVAADDEEKEITES